MTILSIDSSNNNLSGAIFQEVELTSFCIEPENIQKTRNQKSSIYLPKIIELFEEVNINPQELSLIAVSTGPGSFTGVRTALSIAKTIACEYTLPIFTANNFELIRYEHNIERNETVLLNAGKTGYFISKDSDYQNPKTNYFSQNIPEENLTQRVKEFKEKNISLTLAQYYLTQKQSSSPSTYNFDKVTPYYLREPSIGKKKSK